MHENERYIGKPTTRFVNQLPSKQQSRLFHPPTFSGPRYQRVLRRPVVSDRWWQPAPSPYPFVQPVSHSPAQVRKNTRFWPRYTEGVNLVGRTRPIWKTDLARESAHRFQFFPIPYVAEDEQSKSVTICTPAAVQQRTDVSLPKVQI